MKKLIASIVIAVGCKSPPPITDGKCRIMSYSGRDPDERQCVYEGYVWTCHGDGEGATCARGAEAHGEAPAAEAKP